MSKLWNGIRIRALSNESPACYRWAAALHMSSVLYHASIICLMCHTLSPGTQIMQEARPTLPASQPLPRLSRRWCWRPRRRRRRCRRRAHRRHPRVTMVTAGAVGVLAVLRFPTTRTVKPLWAMVKRSASTTGWRRYGCTSTPTASVVTHSSRYVPQSSFFKSHLCFYNWGFTDYFQQC